MTDHDHGTVNDGFVDYVAVYQSCAKEFGLSVPMLRVLETVCLHPGCTQKVVGEHLQTSKQRVNALVRALTQKQMLTQTADENDGRSRLLHLTPRGTAAAQALLSHRQVREAQIPPGTAHTHVLEDGTVITHTHDDEHGHGHVHSHEHTKAVLDRLSRSIGHLEKVRRMVEDGEDCSKVLVQLSAVKAAVNSTGKLILKDHIEHCLVDAIEHGDRRTLEELNEAIDQFIK